MNEENEKKMKFKKKKKMKQKKGKKTLRKEVRKSILGFYLSLKYDIKIYYKNYKFNKCFLYVKLTIFALSFKHF